MNNTMKNWQLIDLLLQTYDEIFKILAKEAVWRDFAIFFVEIFVYFIVRK